MKDAFGVSKSFSSAIKGANKFKPISQMTAAERAGIKGYHSKFPQNASRWDKETSSVRTEATDAWRRARMNTLRTGRNWIRRRGKTIVPAQVAESQQSTLAGITVPMGSRPGTSQRQAKYVLAMNPKAPEYKSVLAHEAAHTEHRKPLSAYVRYLRRPEKSWGEEARADSRIPEQIRRKTSPYYNVAHKKIASTAIDPDYQRGSHAANIKRYLDVEAKLGRGKKKRSK